jgi:hypothetical protein
MHLRRFAIFAGKFALVHVVTYFVVGAVAYQLLTKGFYEGEAPIFASFMRTPANPEAWQYVMRWFIPGQLLRGVLMAAALYTFFDTLINWQWTKRFLVIAGLYLIFGYWASAVAAPGTIDGLIYMRPEITTRAHLLVQPEIVLQGLALAAWLAWWMARGVKSEKMNHQP